MASLLSIPSNSFKAGLNGRLVAQTMAMCMDDLQHVLPDPCLGLWCEAVPWLQLCREFGELR